MDGEVGYLPQLLARQLGLLRYGSMVVGILYHWSSLTVGFCTSITYHSFFIWFYLILLTSISRGGDQL